VPYSAGGSTDRLARILAVKLSSPEYNFIVEYRLGGAGSVAASYVAEIKNETVIMITSNGLIGGPLINHTDRYDVERDFTFVGYLGAEPLMILVNPTTKIYNFREFLRQAKIQQMPYGSSGIGSSSHLTGAIVARQNPNLIHIPYKGGSSSIIDFLAGRITWIAESESSMGNYIEDGKAKPLAVFYHRRLDHYPTVPTVKEYGINDRNFYRWHIMIANSSADPLVIHYLQTRLKESDIKHTIESLGIDVTAPKNLDNFLKIEAVKMKQIIQDFNITQ
jgi:tripartite-type tricarboxylate transporter receptor subunit TctC